MENNLQSKLGDDFSKYVKVFKFNKICPDMNKLDAVFKYLESIRKNKINKIWDFLFPLYCYNGEIIIIAKCVYIK